MTLSLLVLYSNFIGVKWEKEALVPRVLRESESVEWTDPSAEPVLSVRN